MTQTYFRVQVAGRDASELLEPESQFSHSLSGDPAYTRIAIERAGWVAALGFMNELSTPPEGSAEERRMTQEFIEAMNAAPAPGATALADVATLRRWIDGAGHQDGDEAALAALARIEAALRAAR